MSSTTPFPLLQLPPEILLSLLHHLDARPSSPTFPPGPNPSLLALSLTSIYLHTLCRPLIWRSIDWVPQERSLVHRRDQPHPSLQPERGLRALRDLMVDARASQRGRMKIKALSYTSPQESIWDASDHERDEIEAELEALRDVLLEFGDELQVVFLKGVETGAKLGGELLSAVWGLEHLSALRLNSVEVEGKLGFLNQMDEKSGLRTLQVMHGSPELMDLVRLTPHIESLLLWPSSRRFGSLTPILVSKLPQLRLLSLDSVREPAVFDALAHAIKTLSSTLSLPLEELFLEGRQSLSSRQSLLESLSLVPSLHRLSLYHLRDAKPRLISDIAHHLPHLSALTLVLGDTSAPVSWPNPLSDYLDELQKFKRLEFFAWDRKAPTIISESEGTALGPLRTEYQTLQAMGRTLPRLNRAVCITQDVSEGSSGYFAEFTKMKGARRMDVRKKTVRDFLVDFERWCVINEE